MATNTQFAFADLGHTLFLARQCDEVWWLLEGTHPNRTIICKACNRHLNFFQALRPGMFVCFIVKLSSVFDERKDSISLKSIPELAKHASFPQLWEKGRRLYRYRSKAIAHRDVNNASEDFARATGFTHDELRAILKESCRLYDDYADTRNLAKLPSPHFSSAADLLRILHELAM